MLYPVLLILATSAYLIFWTFHLCVTLRKCLSLETESEYSLSGEPKHRLLYYDTVSDFYLWQVLT